MFKIIFVLFLSIGAINCIPKRTARLMGGIDAKLGEFPYMVEIRESSQICGGAIISDRLILTSSGCVNAEDVSVKSLTVEYGIINTNTKGKFSQEAANIYVHEEGGLAIFNLKTKIVFSNFVQPVKLPTPLQKFAPGTKATLCGFGATNTTGDQQYDLKKVELEVYHDATCKKFIQNTTTQFCAGVAAGGKTPCIGDSGSPLTVKGVLIGVSKYYNGNCGGWGGRFVKVSKYVDWINKQINVAKNDILSSK